MPILIDDAKRTAIACQLADMKEVQNTLIANEEKLIGACNDQDIRDRLGKCSMTIGKILASWKR
jgi:hypothetical protein